MSEAVTCPVCGVEMKKDRFEGVEIDRCPQCKGIWFDLLEHEDLKAMKGSEAIDVGAGSASQAEEGRILDCPRCHTRMSPTRDPRQPHIVFEKCSQCYGVFFDAGEFTDLKELTFKEFVRTLF